MFALAPLAPPSGRKKLSDSCAVVGFNMFKPFGGFLKWGIMGVPQHGWFIRENPAKMDDLGDPHLWKPPLKTINIRVVCMVSVRYFKTF